MPNGLPFCWNQHPVKYSSHLVYLPEDHEGKIVICHSMDSLYLNFSRGSLSHITFSENGEVTSLRASHISSSFTTLESRSPSYSEHCTKSPVLSELCFLCSLPPSLLFFPFSFPKQDAAKETVKCLAQ